MPILIHRADHPRLLVDELCESLARVPEDPLRPELISVPTNGIQRWLSERIALNFAARGVGDGIAANIEWPYPGTLVRRVLTQIPGMETTVAAWRGREAERHIELVITENLGEPWMELLDRFVRSGPGGEATVDDAQRLRAARKIRRLFGDYSRRRPAMIRAWARDEDVGPDGAPIAVDAAWQPRLWRRLRESIGIPSPPEAVPDALEAIRAGGVDLDLPERLSVYGLTSIDPAYLDVFAAIGADRDVYLYLLHASPALWEAVASCLREAPPATLPRRVEDPSREAPQHPILRSWAQDSRELQVALHLRGLSTTLHGPQAPRDPAGTLLGLIQRDIRANDQTRLERSDPKRQAVAGGTDRSIQVHVCYGAQRQVEVARDAILHLLQNDETLEPRDVVIMTPDLETYAPLIEAGFPAEGSGSGLPDLRVRIADRSPSRRNPLVRFAGTLLTLAGSRLDAGAVRDLIALPIVQRRFGLDPDMVGSIEDLIDDANIRWGFDGDHRERFGTAPRSEHTWRRGIARALAGVFYSDGPVAVGGVAPIAGIEGEAARAAGLLAHIVGRLEAVAHLLARRRPSSEWTEAVATAVGLLAATDYGAEWQWSQLERTLERTFAPEDEDGADPVIGLDEAIVLTTPWTEDRPSPLHHQTGNVTVCTLVPMRSVPYRVVCLVGMDAERFPRTSRADGDDLLIDHEIVGDHDRGAEDRQLLLDALMAAGDHFIVTYAGRDELTNAVYPPAVPIAELRDVIAETVGEDAAARVVTEHPLQSFSLRNFREGALGLPGPWGFDPMYASGAQALRDRRAAEPSPEPVVVPAVAGEGETELGLDDLIAFFAHPCRAFARSRMRLTIPEPGERADDELPIELDPLGKWSLTNRLLEGLTRGHPVDDLAAHERGRDSLPPGALGEAPLAAALERAAEILALAGREGFDPSAYVQRAGVVDTPAGSLSGSVTADPGRGMVADVTPSRLKGKQRFSLYVRVLFLSVLEPATAWRGLLVGRAKSGSRLQVVTIEPLTGGDRERRGDAAARLGDLIEVYREGMTRPLPIFSETSYTWVTARPIRREVDTARAWVPDPWGYGAEGDDAYHLLLFPGLVTLDDLLEGDFPGLAERIWRPVTELLGPKR